MLAIQKKKTEIFRIFNNCARILQIAKQTKQKCDRHRYYHYILLPTLTTTPAHSTPGVNGGLYLT